VDVLWIGHFDLTCSLGIPGQFDDAKFTQAVAKVTAACKKHGKSLGRLVPDVATGIALHRAGFDFLSYSGDVWVYQAAVAAGVHAIREGVAGGAAEAAAAKHAAAKGRRA
jgi:2-keto-3-deoxy-L-rhamnonate aldolase RhmA